MRKSILRLALVSGAVIVASGPASANHQWENYHWARTANPITLTVNTSITSAWKSYVDTARSQWSASSVINLTLGKTSGISAKKCSPIAGQIVVCNAAYGQRGWLGIASIWANGDHITQGTTKLNDSYYGSTSRYNTPEWRAMVACQEIGHDFGLGHVNETFTDTNTGSCMDYTNDPSGKAGTNGTLANIAPNSHDYAELESMYAHSDSTNTAISGSATNFGERRVGQPAPQALPAQESGDSPAEWGRAVHFDGKGRADLYVLDLGAGHRKITHVFWAPDFVGGSHHHHDD